MGAIPPPPFVSVSPLREHAKWRCDTPLQKGYLSDTCAIPYENKANGCDTPLCDTISKGYYAIWGVSRTGPLSLPSYRSRTKNQPKEEVFGPDIPRTSGGHSRGYPGPKFRSGRSKSWKNKHLGADIHDPKPRTSTTLRDFQKLRAEKLWAEFSFPNRRTTPARPTTLTQNPSAWT